ncbi:MAG: HlyD family efflux transporter periplasmic adaptor subunit [Nevskiales bacterium]|nr:HlyD family efflux transporter periplasmic adaptor subunit [Nevskiales bacterium]
MMKNVLLTLGFFLLAACEQNPPYYPGYVEGEYIRVAVPVAGQIVSLAVERGTEVPAGAPLFTLEQVREQAAVAEAEARLAAARAQLADLHKGKREDEIAVIRAQAEQARADQQLADAQLKRQQELNLKGLVSAEQLDRAQTERERSEARVRELEAQVRSAELSARSDTVRAAAQQVGAAEAQLAQVRWLLQQKSPLAPAAGRVEDVYYRVGEWVPAGAPVLSLLPPENRAVRFFVPEPILGTLQQGQPVQVSCDGCASPVTAQVSFIASEAEFTPPVLYSRDARHKLVFRIEARPLPEAAGRLHPGQPVEVTLVP